MFALTSSLALLSLFAYIAYLRFFHPLAKHPGPLVPSISRAWLIYHILCGDVGRATLDLHKKHGPAVRIAPDEVSISDPRAVREIYNTAGTFKKTDFYLGMRSSVAVRYPDLFTNLDPVQHARRRKIVSGAYAMSSILTAEPRVDAVTAAFASQLGKFADTGEALDLALWFQMYAYDVVGELYLGRAFGFLARGADVGGYIAAVRMMLPLISVAAAAPRYLRGVLFGAGMLFPGVKGAANARLGIDAEAKRCVTERVRERDAGVRKMRGENILDKLLDIVVEKGAELDFNDDDVTVEVWGALVAGSDTTAIALSSIMYHLMRHPSARAALKAEVAAAGLGTPVPYADAARLPYLDAVVKEAMRLHPSVGMSLPREVPHGGHELAGAWFEGGTKVGVNAVVVQRDKGVFGEDASEFRPERWLEGRGREMERAMLQFGGGSRTCSGKNISLCEIYKLIPELLTHFDFQLQHPSAAWNVVNNWFNQTSNLSVTVRKRE